MRRGTVEHVRAGCIVPPGAIWLPPSRTTAPTSVGGLEPGCASRREAAGIRSPTHPRRHPVRTSSPRRPCPSGRELARARPTCRLPEAPLAWSASRTDDMGVAMADAVRHGNASAVTEGTHRLPIKTLVSASIGNAVEWFDWTVYATFVVFFAGQFFPAENEALALIGATSAYALAFFFRPLGGLLLGRFADLRGRKAGMLLTILLMAGGSMVIAILPTYEQVGWLAPILLLLARIAQGMSLGGEVSNASAYLGEIAPPA